MKRRVFCLLLGAVLVLFLLPLGVWAANSADINAAGPSRAQWYQSLVRTFDMTVREDEAPDNYYTDLTGEEDYYRDILVAVNFGLVDVEEGLPFRPDEPITRQDAAHSLNFCLGFLLQEKDYTFSESASVSYPDDLQIALNRGWFALSGASVLPEQPLTQAEASAMLADAKNVLAGAVIDTNYSSTYSYQGTYTEVPEGTPVVIEDGAVRITDCPVTIQSGDVFVVYVGGLPSGFLSQSVRTEGADTVVTCTKIEGEDLFSDIDAQGVVEAEFTYFKPLEGAEVLYVDETTGEEYDDPAQAEAAVRHAKRTSWSGMTPLRSVKILNKDIKITGNVKANVSLIVNDPKVYYRFDTTAKSFYVELLADYTAQAKLTGDLTDYMAVHSIPLFEWGVPGVGGLKISMNYSLSVEAVATVDGSFSLGLEGSEADGVRMIKHFEADLFTCEVDGQFKTCVSVEFGINDAPGNIVRANVFAEAGIKVKASYKHYSAGEPEECMHLAAYAYAECGYEASVKVGLFKESVGGTYAIWNEQNSPVRIVHHYENGKEVPSCTRGWDCTGGKVGNNGYYTRYNSRFSGGWSRRSGTHGLNAAGEPVEIYKYTLDKDGHATISSYTGNVSALTIPGKLDGYTVTAIGKEVFKNHKEIRSVTMADSITNIGNYAFDGCSSLRNIDFSDHLDYIGIGTFRNCVGLTAIHIPKSLNSTGFTNNSTLGPFVGCSNLHIVTFEEGITKIPSMLLSSCEGLRSITIPDTVITIETYSFAYCPNLREIKLPDSVATIEKYAFLASGLSSFISNDYLTRIEEYAFKDCSKLSEVYLSRRLTFLGNGVFDNCDLLSSIDIPKSLTDTSFQAYDTLGPFCRCDGLKTVTFEAGITAIPPRLLAGCGGVEEITIPDTVTVISDQAFANAANLKTVTLSGNLRSIGKSAFLNCTALEKITMPPSLQTIGQQAFQGCFRLKTAALNEGLTNIADDAFHGCTYLTGIQLPKTLTSLGMHAFQNCEGLTSIEIPKSLTKVGNPIYSSTGTFQGCTNLKTATFEAGTELVVDRLFSQCPGLETITLPPNTRSIGNYAFFDCKNLRTITIPEGCESILGSAFRGSGLESITLPESVAVVNVSAFQDCISLKSAVIPAARQLNDYAFAGCTYLEQITLPETMTSIGANAFDLCENLKSVTVPDGIVTLNRRTFVNCKALTDVHLPDSLTSISDWCFEFCESLTSVTLPPYVQTLGTRAFAACSKLSDIKLSNCLRSIGDGCFDSDDELTELVFPHCVTSIGKQAFTNNPKLTKLTILRDCTSIPDNCVSYPSQLTVYGVKGTEAEAFAGRVGAAFEEITAHAQSVKLSRNELSIAKNASVILSAETDPMVFCDETAWKSSDTKIVTVTDQGVIKGVSVGTATITFAAGNVKDTCTVTVYQNVTSITTNYSSINPLNAGRTFQLTAKVQPANALNSEVIWASSDESVATVDQTGLVTGVGKGSCTITVTAADGGGAKKEIPVTVPNDLVVAFTPEELQSDHPYNPNENKIWQYTVPGAEKLYITFSADTMLEEGGADKLTVATGTTTGKIVFTLTGSEMAGKTYEIPGDTVRINLISDGTLSEYGFRITDVSVEKPQQPDPDPKPVFTDVPAGAYYAPAVDWAVENGVTAGTSKTTFSPGNTCTRAQVVTFLWRAKGQPEPKGTNNPFTDVSPSAYYYKAVLWAVENGITAGTSKTTFSPNAGCTRGQVVTFLWRTENQPAPGSTASPFTDVPANAYYYKAVLWAVERKITAGTSKTTFAPNNTCTRAQIVTFLFRDLG